MLSVRRGNEAVRFYTSAFSALILFRLDADNGDVVAQLSIRGAIFWITDESTENGNFSPESLRGSTTRMVLIVDDPASAVAQALAAGATSVWPVEERHGWLIGRVVDPYGHHWEIGRKLE
jgi:PhnB protein